MVYQGSGMKMWTQPVPELVLRDLELVFSAPD